VDLIDSISIYAPTNAVRRLNPPRQKKKDPAQGPGLLANSKNLAMMMAVMTTMMMG
jgi:hypothetical protein